MTNLTRILQAFKSIQSTEPQLMSSNNVKRAAVALILRFRPNDGYRNRSPTSSDDSPSNLNSIDQLFSQPWMQDGAVTPEVCTSLNLQLFTHNLRYFSYKELHATVTDGLAT